MKCLMCQRELGYGGITDILFGDDPLCISCRRQWRKKRVCFQFEGHRLRSSYLYNKAFSQCLIQYKELGDEALKDAFLYEEKKWFRRTYRGFAALMMPSAAAKEERRGFSHLKRMFECTGIEILEPFVKTGTDEQKGKGKAERREMETGILLKPDAVLPDQIVLCDDTMTTGSTFRGALRALENYGGKTEIYTVSVNSRWL